MRHAILLSALSAVGLASGARADQAFGPHPVAPEARTFHVGALELTALHDAQFVVPNDGKTFGLAVGPAAVAEVLRAAGAPTDRITLSVNALLVRDGRRLLLLDSGLGPKLHGGLQGSLRLAGVAPNAVTDVLITHPHGDHIGGLLDAQGQLAFPAATIRMSSADWAWLQKQAKPDLIRTLAPRVRTFAPGARVAPGITSVALPGHTPGQVGYEIVSGSARLLDIGDVAHSAIVSLARPQWSIQFDNDKPLARQTRQKTLAELAKRHERVFAPHFPFPGVGYIMGAGGTYTWKADVP